MGQGKRRGEGGRIFLSGRIAWGRERGGEKKETRTDLEMDCVSANVAWSFGDLVDPAPSLDSRLVLLSDSGLFSEDTLRAN